MRDFERGTLADNSGELTDSEILGEIIFASRCSSQFVNLLFRTGLKCGAIHAFAEHK